MLLLGALVTPFALLGLLVAMDRVQTRLGTDLAIATADGAGVPVAAVESTVLTLPDEGLVTV